MSNLIDFPSIESHIVLDELVTPDPVYIIYRIQENSRWVPIDFAFESELRLIVPMVARGGDPIGIRREEECPADEVRWLLDQIVAGDRLAAETDGEFDAYLGCNCSRCGDAGVIPAGDMVYDCPACGNS